MGYSINPKNPPALQPCPLKQKQKSPEQVAKHTRPFSSAAIVVRLQGITGLLLRALVVGFGGLIDGVGTRLPQPPVGSEPSKPRRLSLAARDQDAKTRRNVVVLQRTVGGVSGKCGK